MFYLATGWYPPDNTGEKCWLQLQRVGKGEEKEEKYTVWTKVIEKNDQIIMRKKC